MSVLLHSYRLALAGAMLATPLAGLAVTLAPSQSLSEDQSFQVAVADVDGDNDLDLVFGQYDDYVEVWLNDGTGQFSNAGIDLGNQYTSSLYVVDANNDNHPDLFVAGGSGLQEASAQLLLNNGSGNFSENANVSVSGEYPADWTIADVDADGELDMVALNRSTGSTKYSVLWIWYGSDDYAALPSKRVLSDLDCTRVEAADLAGDSGDELVVGCRPYNADGTDYAGGIQVWEHDGMGLTELTAVLKTDWDIGDVDFTDIDGNGHLDIIGTHFNSSTPVSVTGKDHSVWTNDNGTFTEADLDFEGISLDIADVDGDSRDDLLIADGSNVRLYLGESGTSFAYQAGAANVCSAYVQHVATGDLNDDGKTDLAVAGNSITDPADFVLIQDGTNTECPTTGGSGSSGGDSNNDDDSDDGDSEDSGGGGTLGFGFLLVLGLLSVVRIKRD
ncbi:FG-GAP repeat domain-containing protein [Saccharospirillum salsuginis]|uniref:VCBS repeat-containing protein n=1 Tax=Saccharospirillum salsuginis TaxID=418750 RepID=A0A918KMH2_9GAMM|nr:VCBS repeat-containing protein [Saccharospirillum salsuginis]GGX66664.1 hypothetical protein GCM10007392_38010 [Saccharospirillum salsuginis]